MGFRWLCTIYTRTLIGYSKTNIENYCIFRYQLHQSQFCCFYYPLPSDDSIDSFDPKLKLLCLPHQGECYIQNSRRSQFYTQNVPFYT